MVKWRSVFFIFSFIACLAISIGTKIGDGKQIDNITREKRGYLQGIGNSQIHLNSAFLESIAKQASSYSDGNLGSTLHQFLADSDEIHGGYGSSHTDVANQAAGEATAAAASQSQVAQKAAHRAAKKIAAQVQAASQKAQEAAVRKYNEAAQLTQAAQVAQALVFREASQASQTGRTVQAAKAIKQLALAQIVQLKEALSTSRAQAVVANQILAAAAASYLSQSSMLKKAHSVATSILQRQRLSLSQLADTQAAAQQAQAAATTAYIKSKGPTLYDSHSHKDRHAPSYSHY